MKLSNGSGKTTSQNFLDLLPLMGKTFEEKQQFSANLQQLFFTINIKNS